MAANPTVYAIMGSLFMDPPESGSGGTELLGVDVSQPIRVVLPHGAELEWHGLESDAVRSVKSTAPDRTRLIVPARGADVETLKMLFASGTSDGSTLTTDGEEGIMGGHAFGGRAAALRSLDPTEKHWYFPRLQIDPEADAFMSAHPIASLLDGTQLVLVCARLDNSDMPAGARGTAVALDALFDLGGA